MRGVIFFTYLNEENLSLTPELEEYKVLKDSLDKVKRVKQDSIDEEKRKERKLKRAKDDDENDDKKKIDDKNAKIKGIEKRNKQKKEIKKTPKEQDLIKQKSQKNTKQESIDKKLELVKRDVPINNIKKARLPKKNIGKWKREQALEKSHGNSKVRNKVKKHSNSTGTNTKGKEITTKTKRVNRKKEEKITEEQKKEDLLAFVSDTVISKSVLKSAINNVRQNKSKLNTKITQNDRNRYEYRVYQVQWHKIIASSFACFVMFLIGAPLGAIIKRGGLGVPVLISIMFFIIFYVLTMTGEKWAKQDMINPILGMWLSNLLLFPIGLFFLRQARNDARLFDVDFYNVFIAKMKEMVKRKRGS